ncbi:MAG: hypothetical protein KDD73_04365 [Anaerolineales bacterium]|nr:hypothetical protein [Anaerolineales bacterium]MCB9126758.1 hypothetical protein [Ardenticatenales bacterium]
MSNFWLIGLSNSFHLIATVVWIGWGVLLPLVVSPHVAAAHQEGDWRGGLLRRISVAYGAALLLWATGMLQMSANANYEGFLAIGGTWSLLMLAKHLVVLVNIGLMVLLGHQLSPALRLAVRRDALGKVNNLDALAGRFRVVAWLNLVVCLAVLALTGLLTAVP